MNDKQNILDELKEISPVLYEMKQQNHHSFGVPDNYFSELKENVFAAIEIGLSEEIGKDTFAVPPNYFNNLSGNIMAAIDAEEEAVELGGKVIELQSSRNRTRTANRRWFSMAAAVAAVVLVMFNLSKVQIGPATENTEISQADALEYIEDNFSDFESNELYSLVSANDEDLSIELSEDFGKELENYIENNIDDWDTYLLTNEI